MENQSGSVNASPPPQNLFSKSIAKISEKFAYRNKVYVPKIAFFVFSLLLLISVALFFQLKYPSNQFKGRQVEYLAVISASPRGTVSSSKPKISVKFNLPVTAHHVEEYFSVSPFVEGDLIQGSSPEEIVFGPKSSFPRGAYVTITLKNGLPSDPGKKLLNDYSFSFSISYDANLVTFTSKNWSGKFMSFQASRGTDITLKVGSEIASPTVKVSKADIQMLLENLVYNVKTNYGTPKEGEYAEKLIDTNKLKILQEYKDVKDGDKVNFKGNNGVYLFQAYEGESVINSIWVTLNDTGIHLRQDDKKIFLAAQNLDSGKPEGGIDVTFYRLEENPKVLAIHTLSGIQEYPFAYPERLDLVVGRKNDDVMIIPVEIPNSQAEIRLTQSLDEKYQIFLYTDRPVYRSNAKVSFRGVLRKDNDALYELPDKQKVRVYTGSDSNFKFDKEFEVTEGGIFYGEFTLPENVKEGTRYLFTTTNLDSSKFFSEGYTYFDVFEYKKPTFGLDIEVSESELVHSEKTTAKVIGRFFNGQPFRNQKVKLTIYSRDYYETEKAVYNTSFKLNGWGGMCGGGGFDEYYGQPIGEPREIELDKNGEARLEFSTDELKSLLSQEITYVAEKTDDNGNKIVAAKSAIVHQGEFNVFFRPGPGRIAYDQEFTLAFYAEDLNGQKIADKDFSYEIYEESWKANQAERKIIKSESVKTDENGFGVFKEKLGKDGSNKYFYVSVKTQDSLNNKIEARKGILFFNKDEEREFPTLSSSGVDQTILKITSFNSSLKVGDAVSLEIIAPDDMTIFGSFERGRVYTPSWIELKKGVNTFKFDVLPQYSPSITPTFSFFYKGEYFIEGLSLNIPALHKLITVEVSTDKEKYNPGDTAIITVTTKDKDGNLLPVDIGAAIIDKAIFALRKNAAPPLHSSFYYFRNRSTNTSSSLTWIATYDWRDGRGGGGGGFEAFLKDSDTLYWNPSLKTGDDGQVKIEIPVGQTETTWRVLIYASSDDTKVGQSSKDFLVSGR